MCLLTASRSNTIAFQVSAAGRFSQSLRNTLLLPTYTYLGLFGGGADLEKYTRFPSR